MTEEPTPPQPLAYATRVPPDVRISKLPIAALVVSFLACPALWVVLANRVGLHFASAARWELVVRTAIMGVATAVAVVALVRVRRSRGRLLGEAVAWWALVISLLWWVCLAAVLVMFILIGGPE